MLNSNMAEKARGQLKVPGNSDVVNELVQYMYTDSPTSNLVMVAEDLLPIAHMYELEGLVRHCQDSLVSSVITTKCQNVAKKLILLYRHGSKLIQNMDLLIQHAQMHLYELSREDYWPDLKAEKVIPNFTSFFKKKI